MPARTACHRFAVARDKVFALKRHSVLHSDAATKCLDALNAFEEFLESVAQVS